MAVFSIEVSCLQLPVLLEVQDDGTLMKELAVAVSTIVRHVGARDVPSRYIFSFFLSFLMSIYK
jgi:hypothetical protein